MRLLSCVQNVCQLNYVNGKQIIVTYNLDHTGILITHGHMDNL